MKRALDNLSNKHTYQISQLGIGETPLSSGRGASCWAVRENAPPMHEDTEKLTVKTTIPAMEFILKKKQKHLELKSNLQDDDYNL